MTAGRSTELLLGIDVGTTSCKAAVVTPDGAELAHGRAPVRWTIVPSGAEIAPADLVAAAVAAGAEALGGAPAGPIAGLGVASMAETGVLLDRSGRPLAPAIAWHDGRGGEEAEQLARQLGAERFAERTGLAPRPLCSVVKHRWLRDHVPGTERAVRWLNVAEWVVRELGGDEQAELSLASRTGWLDIHARTWWDEALEWSGASAALLPPLAPAGTPAGTAGDALPRARGAVLAIGGHDHLSAAVGAGAVGDGDVLDSCGTAEAFIRATAPLPPERVREAVALGINVGWHAVPGRQCLLGSARTGAMLERVMGMLGVPPERRAELETAALAAPAGAGGIEVHGIGEDGATITGIGAGASPGLVWRAALEAADACAAAILRNMETVAGPRRRLVVAGGWAEGDAARRVKQERLGPFTSSAAAFVGARGAALTAGRAAGVVAPIA
jgi:sugar (pentulose or hexulose) kinase